MDILHSNINNDRGHQAIGNTVNVVHNYYRNASSEENQSICPVALPYKFNLTDPVKNFVGRVDEIENIHKSLQNSSKNQTVVICGVGGIGKTETAKRYAEKYCDEYKIILYLEAHNEISLKNSIFKIAKKFGIEIKYNTSSKEDKIETKYKSDEDIIKKLYDCCCSFGFTLVIFNDVDEQENIIKYMPQGHKYEKLKIIITSRKQDCKFENYDTEEINLKPFDFQTVSDYVSKNLNSECYDESQTKQLDKYLESLPLALKQAVSYIANQNKNFNITQTHHTINHYIKKYEECRTELSNNQYMTNTNNSTVSTTCKITIDKIKSEKGEIGSRAVDILESLSYLKNDNILCSIFLKDNINTDISTEAIGLLEAYSMISVRDGFIIVHQIVQEVVKMNVKKDEREEEVIFKLLINLTNQNNSTDFVDLERHLAFLWRDACKNINIVKKFFNSTKKESKDEHYSPLLSVGYLYEDTQDIDFLEKLSMDEIDPNFFEKCLCIAIKFLNLKAVAYLIEKLVDQNENYITHLMKFETHDGLIYKSSIRYDTQYGKLRKLDYINFFNKFDNDIFKIKCKKFSDHSNFTSQYEKRNLLFMNIIDFSNVCYLASKKNFFGLKKFFIKLEFNNLSRVFVIMRFHNIEIPNDLLEFTSTFISFDNFIIFSDSKLNLSEIMITLDETGIANVKFSDNGKQFGSLNMQKTQKENEMFEILICQGDVHFEKIIQFKRSS